MPVGGEGIGVSLAAFFCFVLSVFFPEFRWVCLAVLVGFVLGVVGVHGERGVRGGSGGVGALVVL